MKSIQFIVRLVVSWESKYGGTLTIKKEYFNLVNNIDKLFHL